MANNSAATLDVNSRYYAVAQLLPLGTLIVFVNGVVFLLFAKNKRLRTPTNYFLFGLAVCDFLTGLINIPLTIIVFTRVMAPPAGVVVGFFGVVLQSMLVVLVVYHIFIITAERYFSIIHPFRHRWKITKSSVLKLIFVVWLAAIVIAFLPVTWFYRFIYYQEDVTAATLQIQTGHNIFCIVFVFLLPYVLIIYFQVSLYRKIRQGMLVSKREKQKYTVNRKVHNVRRSMMIFGLMAFLYAICWFPWYVISFFSSLWFPLSEEARRTLSKFAHAFLIVRYLTSIVNPVLYTFFKRDFQETFKTVVLRRNIQQENSRTAYLSARQRPPCNIDLANGSSFLAWKHGQLTNIEYVSAV